MSSAEERLETFPPRAIQRRQWLFRLGAVLCGLTPLIGFEVLCMVLGWGKPNLHDDPFVGFRSTRPLFVLNDERTRYEIPKSRQTHFRAESFAAAKAENEFRIFCLGESTVQGNPYGVETSFTTWLELSLQAADASRKWEVVNCGGISYASYRLVPILEEVLRYQPNLIVICVGHNEFLEDRKFDSIRNRGEFLNGALSAAAKLRTFTLMREGYLHLQGHSSADPPSGRPLLPTEVEALLDYRGGLEDYHRDERWRWDVILQYRYNLRRMVELARDAGVRVVLINPVSNWGSSPPFKSEHRADLSVEDREKWEALFQAAETHFRGEKYNLFEAIKLLEQACEIDSLYAGTWYTLAECYRAVGRIEQARNAYLQAKELDVCPLRVLKPMNAAVLELARDTRTPLVDAQDLFERRSRQGIVDGEWLVDHVHPGIKGHQLLGDELANKMIELGLVNPGADWQEKQSQSYRTQLDGLDPIYFVRGAQHLESLMLWAHGRVKKTRATEPKPEASERP